MKPTKRLVIVDRMQFGTWSLENYPSIDQFRDNMQGAMHLLKYLRSSVCHHMCSVNSLLVICDCLSYKWLDGVLFTGITVWPNTRALEYLYKMTASLLMDEGTVVLLTDAERVMKEVLGIHGKIVEITKEQEVHD